MFVDDIATVGRQVFADTAFTLSTAAKEAGKKVEPSDAELDATRNPDNYYQAEPPTTEQLRQEFSEVSEVAENGVAHAGEGAIKSAEENLSGEQKNALFDRLKSVVTNLRKRDDYSTATSTVAHLIQHYGRIYSRGKSVV